MLSKRFKGKISSIARLNLLRESHKPVNFTLSLGSKTLTACPRPNETCRECCDSTHRMPRLYYVGLIQQEIKFPESRNVAKRLRERLQDPELIVRAGVAIHDFKNFMHARQKYMSRNIVPSSCNWTRTCLMVNASCFQHEHLHMADRLVQFAMCPHEISVPLKPYMV